MFGYKISDIFKSKYLLSERKEGRLPKGKAIPLVQGAGKVAEEKRLNVFINYFSDHEFSLLIGKVRKISNIPTKGGLYVVEEDFPGVMETNYDLELPVNRQMQGIANIVSKDLRLMEGFKKNIEKPERVINYIYNKN